MKHIDYDGNKISALQIYNENLKKVVYSYGKAPVNDFKSAYGTRKEMVGKFYSELKRTGWAESEVLAAYSVKTVADMTEEQLHSALNRFRNCK